MASVNQLPSLLFLLILKLLELAFLAGFCLYSLREVQMPESILILPKAHFKEPYDLNLVIIDNSSGNLPRQVDGHLAIHIGVIAGELGHKQLLLFVFFLSSLEQRVIIVKEGLCGLD
jgi:hypothetical protein